MTVLDIIKENENQRVLLQGKNPLRSTDPLTYTYFDGMLKDIPSEYHGEEVLQTAWSLGHDCACICIAWCKGER